MNHSYAGQDHHDIQSSVENIFAVATVLLEMESGRTWFLYNWCCFFNSLTPTWCASSYASSISNETTIQYVNVLRHLIGKRQQIPRMCKIVLGNKAFLIQINPSHTPHVATLSLNFLSSISEISDCDWSSDVCSSDLFPQSNAEIEHDTLILADISLRLYPANAVV